MFFSRRTQSRTPARARSSASGSNESGSRANRGRRAMKQLVLVAALVAPALVAVQVVLAAQPTGDFTISDNTPATNQEVTFTPRDIQDPDGGTASVSSFDYGDGSPLDTDGTYKHTYTTPGTRTVTMTITAPPTDAELAADPNAQAETRQVTDTVTVGQANRNPTAQINCSPAQVNVGEAASCTGSGSDPDPGSSIIGYEWSLDGGPFNAGGSTFPVPTSTAGTHVIRLRVIDNNGARSTNDPSGSVSVNAHPIANIVVAVQSVEPGQRNDTPLVNQPTAFSSSGSSDPEGGALTYEWALDPDGVYNDGTGSAVVRAFPEPGNKTVKLRVTDSKGATAEKSVTFRVNRAPTPGFIFEPITPIINQQISFSSVEPADPDGSIDPLTYAWDLDNDGQYGETGTLAQPDERGPSVKRLFSSAGTYPIALKVTDSGGVTREIKRNVLVQNTIPTGTFSFTPDAPLPGQAITFSGSGSSPTGKAIESYQWDFDFNPATFDPATHTFQADATGATASHAYPSSGPRTVALRIKEAGGGFAIFTRTINVNAPPQASFTVSPASPFTGDPVTLSSTSGDPDGPLSKVEWDLDNDGQFDDAGGGVVFATFAKKGSYPLKLRVTDSRGATAVAIRQVDVRSKPLAVLSGVVIDIRGQLAGKFTRLKWIRVRAPKGSKVAVSCKGGNCPKPVAKRSKGRKKVYFRNVAGRYAPGTKLIVKVTKRNMIGRHTTFTMIRGKEPRRRDLCISPGAKKAKRCPS
jgi:PKD repeat protein